ncbi:MAG: hypothetical protein GYB31_21020 [Bacteroidetes bacterium]|nr:hypothetical protein [Bacteroidota bacterium]
MIRTLLAGSLAAILLLNLTACVGPVETEGIQAPYYDLEAYFKAEGDRLDASGFQFQKTARVNGKTEERQLSDLEWATEFKAFADSDINLPAWYDKYAIDSSFTANGGLERITYTLQDSSLRTKFIQIDFQDDKPKYIEIHRESQSPLATTSSDLTYDPDQGYFIQHKQLLKLSEEKTISVEVEW